MILEKNINTLWNDYYPKVYGYFYSRVTNNEDVADLTSLVLNQFITKTAEIEIQNPHAYLWKIAYHQLISFIKEKKKNLIPIPIDDNFETADDFEEKLEKQVLNTKLEKVLDYAKNTLNKQDYNLFHEVYIEERKIIDVAKELNLRANTITVKLKRILQKLKKFSFTI